MKTKTIDPWSRMDAMMAEQAEPTGPEWFSTPDYATRYNQSLRNASLRLKALTKAGTLEEWKGVGKGPDGRKRMLNKYRFIQ